MINSVQSIDRALDILEALSAAHQGLALSELAVATSSTRTAHRLLASLVGEAMRVHPESGNTADPAAVWRSPCRVSSVLAPVHRVKAHFEVCPTRLAEVGSTWWRETGNEVVYRTSLSPFPAPSISPPSNVRTTPCTAPVWEKASWPTYLRRRCAPFGSRPRSSSFTPKTIATWEDLHADLALIRQRGYAIDDEEHDLGVRCVAAPIFNWNGMPVGAMSISGLSVRMTDATIERFAPKLLHTAGEISKSMGWRP